MHRYRIVTVAAIMLTTDILCLGLNPLIPDVAADEDCPPWAVIDRFGEHGLDIRLRDWWHSRPLSDAARTGDLRLIKWLLDQGVDINATSRSGETALMAAAWAGQVQAAKLLLERGADVDAKNISGRTAMDYARGPRLRPVLDLLYGHRESLTRGGAKALGKGRSNGRSADGKRDANETSGNQARVSNTGTPSENGPVTEASAQTTDNHGVEIERLLEDYRCFHQSDFDDDEFPPLIEAAASSDLQKIKSLIAQGADVDEKMNCGLTPLIAAADCGHAKVVEYLLSKGADVNKGTCYSGTPLIAAAVGAHPDTMRILIRHGADVNEAKPVGYSGARLETVSLTIPFELAAAMGDVDLVKLMLDKGARLPVLGKDALMVALRNGRMGVVKLLEERGVKATLSDLAHLGLTKMIHRRLDTGADVNEPNELGETALMIAAEQGNLKLMEMLLEKGADLTAQGIPALSYAARRGRTKTVKYLMDKGVDVTKKGAGPNLVDVIHNGHIDVLKMLLAHGADVNMQDAYGRTALMEAADLDWLEIVLFLLENGADINLSEKNGATAVSLALNHVPEFAGVRGKDTNYELAMLLWKHGARFNLQEVQGSIDVKEKKDFYYLVGAIYADSIEGLRQLLDLGLDINTSYDTNDDTPLMVAVRKGKTEMVKLLLERGAKVNVTDWSDKTPLDIAQENGFKDIIRLLVEHGAKPVATKESGN